MMEILAIVGVGIFLLGGLGFLITAFKQHVLWGLGCLFLGPVSLVFLVMHWNDAKRPFFLQLAGAALVFIASFMSGSIYT